MALAAGSTLSAAAQAFGVHRSTVYRWIKNRKEFSPALQQARAESVLALRDELHDLSRLGLQTLRAVLVNSKSSPAVLLRGSMFILQRPQLPKTGWCVPEPIPDPDGKKLIDSATLEQDYDALPGLYHIERDDEWPGPGEPAHPAPSPAAATEYDRVQPDSQK